MTFTGGHTAAAAPPTMVWSDVWNDGQAWSDEARMIRVAPSGDTFVVGHSYTPAQREDIIVLHYLPGGTLDWERRYDSKEGLYDEPWDIELASNGDLLISASIGSVEPDSVALLRYDAAGELVWEKMFAMSGQWKGFVEPKLAVDSTGRIAQFGTLNESYLALLYDSDGTLLWSRTWKPKSKEGVIPTDIAIDPAGRVIVTGYEAMHPNPYWTAAWDVNGNFLWDNLQPGDINAALGPARIAIDSNGDIVLNATPETTCGIFQYRTWKLNGAGQEQWDRFYPDEACDTREPTAMAVDHQGNIFITGFGLAANLGFDTVKYNSAGTRLWRELFHQPSNTVDFPYDIVTDDAGSVYIVGETTVVIQAPNIDRDFTVVKYSPAGELLWTMLLDDDGTSRGYGIALGTNRDVHVVGHGQYEGKIGVITMRLTQRFDPGDLTGDGTVDVFDLFQLLSNWGECPSPCPSQGACTADITNPAGDGTDCVVNVFDLFALLTNWG